MATISSEIEKKYDIYVKEQTGKLIQDLNSARKERRLCDCLIKVGSEEIPAHRIILSEGCDYYRGMFTHEMRESQSGVVEMKGVDPECMVICIEYIYTGKITVRESKIHPLLQIAQMLQLTGLFDALVAFLVQHLDAESFFVTGDLANNFGLTELQKKCEQYGEQNFEAISQQEGFQHIDKRSIISLVTSEGNKTPEGIKLKSIFDWIKYEPKERKKTLRELHKYIDLPKVPVEYRRNLIEDEPLVHSCSELMRRICISVMDTANIQSCDVGAVGGTAVLQPNVTGTFQKSFNEKGSDEVIPSFWAPMQNQPFLKVALNPGSSEYQTAYSYYRKMGGSGNIVKIERIQNVSLHKQFIAKKAEVAKKMQSKIPVERQLFHGTADDDKIVLHGFDRSYAGMNATVHGLGVYFALEASYAISYARPNSQGYRRVFLADVITGDYCQGHSSYKAPPPKPSGIASDVYDSVVNRMPPTVWVIFKDASAYPKFLITFI